MGDCPASITFGEYLGVDDSPRTCVLPGGHDGQHQVPVSRGTALRLANIDPDSELADTMLISPVLTFAWSAPDQPTA